MYLYIMSIYLKANVLITPLFGEIPNRNDNKCRYNHKIDLKITSCRAMSVLLSWLEGQALIFLKDTH
jgi:hypothetical protein